MALGLRARLGQIRRGRVACAVTLPPVVTLLLIGPLLASACQVVRAYRVLSGVSAVVEVVLLGVGFVYGASRRQIDPMSRGAGPACPWRCA
ncbi:MAG: hypothetical protein JO287_25340 [Pseudonocardiales bacterium]|nr:hypothetical protein [Pseudonocardiales bacterium]